MVVLHVKPELSTTHVGYVTGSTLVPLKILNKSFVSVAMESIVSPKPQEKIRKEVVQKNFENHEKNKNNYVLRLFVIDSLKGDFFSNSLMPNVIYISPSDHFNIVNQDISLYRKQSLPRYELAVSITVLPELAIEKQKYVAGKVSVSLIACPVQVGVHQDTIDEVLKDYFLTPKLINKNELFTVNVERHHSYSIHTPPILWFVAATIGDGNISKYGSTLVTNTCFVSFNETELLLLPPTPAFTPRCSCMVKSKDNNAMFHFLSSENFKNIFENYYTQLSNLLNVLTSGLIQSADATVLLEAPRGFGKGLVTQAFCAEHCLHYFEQNCYELIGESMSATEKRIGIMFESAAKCLPCILYLKNVHILCKDKEGFNEERRILHFLQNQIKTINSKNKKYKYPLLIVGSTSKSSEMSARFYSMFLYHMEYDVLNEFERELFLKSLVSDALCDLKEIAKKTSGFIFSDLIALIKKLFSSSLEIISDDDISYDKYTASNILPLIEEIRSLKAGSSDTVNIPKVGWKDVGGLENVKKDIFDTIELPMKFPHLFQGGLQRSGLLFYGPPGCGKTLLAKAIATEFTLNFYNVKGPELLNMYVGQSEENVREVFKKARQMAPCVVFFDELDSLAPARGRSGDSGGVMDRVVSQLLAELDGMHDNTDVFIIGATNRPDLLDTALLRPGRFDKIIYVGIPENHSERLKLLTAVTRKMKLSDDLHLDKILGMCPDNLTGADFKALASDALKCCFRRLISEHKEQTTNLDPTSAIITEYDFKNALETCVPSVSSAEIERYKAIRNDIKQINK